ncbi:MAG: UDP binding domain-containing protein, partial [Microgenomates group bacterium]
DHYWYPGLGYGGSCFPKDVHEIAQYSRSVGFGNNLFNSLHALNTTRILQRLNRYEEKIGGWKGKNVAVLGLSFKRNTDDLRDAPSLSIIPRLLEAGAIVKGFDPKAQYKPDTNVPNSEQYQQVKTIDEFEDSIDVLLILIEWDEIVSYAYEKLRSTKNVQWIIDTRNVLDPIVVKKHGFKYLATGRPLQESL